MSKIKIILALLIVMLSQEIYSQKYEIKLKFPNVKNDTIILGHHFSAQLLPNDTVVTNNKGEAVFKGKEPLHGGMYFLFFSNKKFFDFLISDDQKFTIIGDSTNFNKTIKYIGSEENTIFKNYQLSLNDFGERMKKAREEKNEAEGKKINKEMQEFFDKTISKNPKMFFSIFLKSTKNVDVPSTVIGKKEKYYYFKRHYFDNFDVSDTRLLYTPIYEDRIDTYLDKVIPQHPDSIIKVVDMLIEKSRKDKELFRFMLVKLFNKYASSTMMTSENVYVHIAKKYYIPEAEWSKREFIEKLKGTVTTKEGCIIGKVAKDFKYQKLVYDTIFINKLKEQVPELKKQGLAIEKTKSSTKVIFDRKVALLSNFYYKLGNSKSLYDNKAEYTILWFWTPDCSHCRKETPLFYDLYIEKKMKEKGVKVIAVYLNKDIDNWGKLTKVLNKWFDFVKKNELKEFEHAWAPFGSTRVDYDINSSPVLYLLDKDHKILAKRIGYEQAFELIDHELKQKEKKNK